MLHFIHLIFLVLFIGCSTYPLKVRGPIRLLEQGNYQQAADELKIHAEKPGGDQLAYLLEYSLAQQLAGNFEESNRAFHLADEMSEVKDYISISDEAASLAFSESMVAYKGDDYEKMLINVFSSMNYAALNNYESSLVEIRRLNDKLNSYRSEAGRDYKDNPFAFYFSALMWEQQKQWDSTCIDYNKAFELVPEVELLKEDLLYCSYRSGRWEDLKRFKTEFGVKSYGRSQVKERESNATLVVVFHHGPGPLKAPNPAWHRVPVLRPRYSHSHSLSMSYAQGDSEELVNAHEMVSLEKLSMDSLSKQYAKLIAKRIAARIAKEQIAQRIEKEDEGAALVARIIMDISDQADLRQWTSLPKSLYVVRKSLKPGEYNLKFFNHSSGGLKTAFDEKTVKLEAGKLKLLVLKSM